MHNDRLARDSRFRAHGDVRKIVLEKRDFLPVCPDDARDARG